MSVEKVSISSVYMSYMFCFHQLSGWCNEKEKTFENSDYPEDEIELVQVGSIQHEEPGEDYFQILEEDEYEYEDLESMRPNTVEKIYVQPDR